MSYFVISVPESCSQTKRRRAPSEPPAAHQPGARHRALREPRAPRHRADHVPARQFERPEPLPGLTLGKPSRRSIFSLFYCWEDFFSPPIMDSVHRNSNSFRFLLLHRFLSLFLSYLPKMQAFALFSSAWVVHSPTNISVHPTCGNVPCAFLCLLHFFYV